MLHSCTQGLSHQIFMETSPHWCSFKHFPQADAFPSLLVHNSGWVWVTHILEAWLNTVDIKNSKVDFGFNSRLLLPPCCWECKKTPKNPNWLAPPAAPVLRRASTRQSYQYLRFLSPSDMLFIVKSGTSLGLSLVCLHLKIHLTLRDSVKCIVSSQESKRLWRWPWEDTGSYFLLCVKGGWCGGSSDCSSTCLRLYVCVQVVTLRWITGDEEGVSAPIEYCCSILQTS